MALLDEAMVSIEAGELSTVATGDAYCTVIDACAELSDVVRCRAWTTSMLRWCDTQQELVLYRGHCFIHRAEVLGVLGRWREALVEAQRACDRLAGRFRRRSARAACLEGDLLRLLGDLDAAEAAYARANELGHDPQPGLALLRFVQGGADAAAAMIRARSARPRTRRRAPGCSVRPSTSCSRPATSTPPGPQARSCARSRPGSGPRCSRRRPPARSARCTWPRGDAGGALLELRRAFVSFRDLGVRYEVARTRLLIADACEALGDVESAEMERDAAHAALDGCCADHDRDHGDGRRRASRRAHPARAGGPRAPGEGPDQPRRSARSCSSARRPWRAT